MIGLLLAFMFVIRPIIGSVISAAQRIEERRQPQLASAAGVSVELSGKTPPLTLEQLEEKPMSEVDLARQLAGADAKKFAELLRNWLK